MKRIKKIILIILIVFSLTMIVFNMYKILIWHSDNNENDSDYKYTIKYGKGDIYFIDNYSQTNELEDRATIFEKVCMNDAKDIINNPYLFKKAKYIESEILKYYPMLKDSAIFDSIK